jgi:hypothetical protein
MCTLVAAEKLRPFDRPVPLVRAGDDKVFAMRLRRRLAVAGEGR